MVSVQPAFYAIDLADGVLQMPHDGLLGGAMVSDLHQSDIERLFRQAGIVVDDLLQPHTVGAAEYRSCNAERREGGWVRRPILLSGHKSC